MTFLPTILLLAAMALPVAFAIARHCTRKYIFSALTTLSCAALALPYAPVMSLALFVSFVGDYFMAHKGRNEVMYLLGIAGFFLGHVIFIWHAMLFIPAFSTPEAAPYIRRGLITAAALALWFTPYLMLRVIGKTPKLLRLPVVLYTFISIAGLGCAVMTGNILYSLGIALLLFSDTMIAESDFVGTPRTGRLILPTYYLCHILVAYSALI